MKSFNILLFFISLIIISSCSNEANTILDDIEKNIDTLIIEDSKQIKIEVYNFYKTNKSKICDAMLVNSKIAINDNFKKEIEEGIVQFYEINIDKEINQPIIEKFEVKEGGLYILYTINNVESIENLTEFAYMTALDNSEVYKKGIITNLNDKLKK